MSKDEKQFQRYFLKLAKPHNYHRTSIATGAGFPDTVGFHGDLHSLVELKDIPLGKRGDRKLKQYFEGTQPPWYLEYFKLGGARLFVAMRIKEWSGRKYYGLWRLERKHVEILVSNQLYFSDLENAGVDCFRTYKTCGEMIEGIDLWK